MYYQRSLKIHERGDHYTIRHSGERHSVPLIRLHGKWLKEAGFTAGGQVVVVVEHGRLTILATENEKGGKTV